MKLAGGGKLLRILLGDSDVLDHKPLYEVIVRAVRKEGLAGATMLSGVGGYGADSRVIHTAKILRLSKDLPIAIELIDTK